MVEEDHHHLQEWEKRMKKKDHVDSSEEEVMVKEAITVEERDTMEDQESRVERMMTWSSSLELQSRQMLPENSTRETMRHHKDSTEDADSMESIIRSTTDAEAANGPN